MPWRWVGPVMLLLLALATAALAGLALWRSRAIPMAAATVVPVPVATATSATAQPTPSATPEAEQKTLVIVGDQFARDEPWTTQLGERLGWRVVNLSEDGMGYLAVPRTCGTPPCSAFSGTAARVADAQPDVVLIAGGDADGDQRLGPAVATTLADLKRSVPEARIVALAPLSDRNPRPYWLTLHTRSIQEAATAADVTWIDPGSVTAAKAWQGGALTPAASDELVALLAKELS